MVRPDSNSRFSWGWPARLHTFLTLTLLIVVLCSLCRCANEAPVWDTFPEDEPTLVLFVRFSMYFFLARTEPAPRFRSLLEPPPNFPRWTDFHISVIYPSRDALRLHAPWHEGTKHYWGPLPVEFFCFAPATI